MTKEEFMETYPDALPEMVDAFFAFHRKNPEIYKLFKNLAYDLSNTGRKRYAGKTIIEKMRWDHAFSSSDEEFKVSNNHTSYYVRMLIYEDELFATFFQLNALGRKLKK